MTYSELTQWSILHDCEIARLSMVDAHNREFFVIVSGYGEKGYSEKRDEALAMISEAIDLGLNPGEVKWQPMSQTPQLAG